MQVAIAVFGFICIMYYGVLVKTTGKLNTTFSWFWLVIGIFNIGLGLAITYAPIWLKYVLIITIVLCCCIFFIVELMICFAMFTHPPRHLDYIIILGAQVRGTKVTDSLKRRLDKGIYYLQNNPKTEVIVSGGQGKGEDITEALAMSNYLMDCGIEGSRIILEDQSTTTRENLKFSKELIDIKRHKIGIVSNNFHIYRAMFFAKKLEYKRVFGIAASCKPVVFPNYMVREFFAIIQLQLFLR